MDLTTMAWQDQSEAEIKQLEHFIQEQRTFISHLKNAAKTCKIDDNCSKDELDESIEILHSLEDALNHTITELSALTSPDKDGNLLNDNKDHKESFMDEFSSANAYFHTDAKTVVRVEVFEGKTSSNLSERQIDAFPMQQTDKRIQLAPNTMGVIKLYINSTVTLYKKEKTNGDNQAIIGTINTVTDILTPIPKHFGMIEDIDQHHDNHTFEKMDHASLIGQINVKYQANELGEVRLELLGEDIRQKDGKACRSTLTRFVDPSNLGVVKLKGEVLAEGAYKTSEAFEYTLETYAPPSEKATPVEIVEVEFPEESITAISSVCEVYFEIDEHELDSKEIKKLKQWVIALSKNEGWSRVLMEQKAHIKVVGYASPPASEEYNERLGKKRADFVWEAMKPQLGQEVDSNVSSIKGTIKSYGEYDIEHQQQKVIITITEK
ncbi:MAG: OmpA family protein [Aureispira sp.]